ncbi:MAG: hypothetical protein J6562_02170 [Candidatus Schmidhempelia sp.]|nr:hypothetical protein [Candidatus Schmidhempelia sp.]
MAYNLNTLPDPLPELKKFNFLFWIMLLFVFLVIGSITTWIVNYFYSLSNVLLGVAALGLPVGIWLFVFLYGLYCRSYRKYTIAEWNAGREQYRQELISEARRGLYLLQLSLITEYGQNGNANGVISGLYKIQAKSPFNGGIPIAHTTLSMPENIINVDSYDRLQHLLKEWQQEYHLLFNDLPKSLELHVRLFIDMPIKMDNLMALWQNTLGKVVTSTSFKIESSKTSTTFIEQWLNDREHDNALLLVINVHLFNTPQVNEAESAVMMLLAGENAVKRLPQSPDLLVKIYRSEQTPSLNQTLDNALLWGDADDKMYDGVWYSSVSASQNIDIMNYFDKIKFNHNQIINIDTSIGNAQHSAYFLALGLAMEQTANSQNKQLIIVGQPALTASVVTHVASNMS